MSVLATDPEHFPILGEPLAVELANTLYSDDGHVIDFLATVPLMAMWFSFAPAASALAAPRPTVSQAELVRGVRDSVHRVLAASVDGVDRIALDDVADEHLATLNRAAARARSHRRIEWDIDAGVRSSVRYSGTRFDVFVAQLATESIEFLCSPERSLVRRCAHPNCAMFFVQHHHKRRFCHETCAHRARQARYYATIVGARGAKGAFA